MSDVDPRLALIDHLIAGHGAETRVCAAWPETARLVRLHTQAHQWWGLRKGPRPNHRHGVREPWHNWTGGKG